MKTGMNANHLS